MGIWAVAIPTSSYTHALVEGERETACHRHPPDDSISHAYRERAHFARTRPATMLCTECMRELVDRMADRLQQAV